MVNVVHQLPAHYKQIRYSSSMRGTIGSIFTEAEILAFLTKSLDRRKNCASVLSITSIKRPKEGAWLEREERRGDRVEAQAERSRFLIQEIRIGGILPLARIQALDECLEGRQGLCRGEGAVTGTVDKNVTQQRGVPAVRTTLAYACSSWLATSPSPVVCIVRTGIAISTSKMMYLLRSCTAPGSASIRGAAARAFRSPVLAPESIRARKKLMEMRDQVPLCLQMA